MRAGLVWAVVVGCCFAPAGGAAARSPQSACATAWNRSAPAALRASIAARHPLGVFIDSRTSVHTDTWSKGQAPSSAGGRGCGLQFALHGGRVLAVWGAWAGSTIVKWAGPVPSARPVAVPRNGSVHSDGTIGFHG